jgi:hypothetical protein
MESRSVRRCFENIRLVIFDAGSREFHSREAQPFSIGRKLNVKGSVKVIYGDEFADLAAIRLGDKNVFAIGKS